jgi:hypothetical protein
MSRAHRILVLAGVAVLSASTIATAQPPRAEETGRGSVRHSSAKVKKKKKDTAKRTTARTTSARRSGARAGYRAGYRRGRYHGWNDARRSYRRWRAVTGLFKLGVYAATKPKRTTTVVVTGTTYYYAGGVYYVASGSGYVVVAPPPGAVVYSVPTYTTVVYVGTTEYLYVNGTYYVPTTKPAEQPPPPDTAVPITASAQVEEPSDIPMIETDEENYEVVAPPVGATVPYVPEEAYKETINGTKYFVYEGTYYKPFAGDGETIYMVVENPRQNA